MSVDYEIERRSDYVEVHRYPDGVRHVVTHRCALCGTALERDGDGRYRLSDHLRLECEAVV